MSRIISTEALDKEEEKSEYSLRPQYLNEYIGQEKVKDNLRIFIEAAKKRKEPLDHLLLYGPPGLGKTTLSTIVANEMGVNIKITSGPAIEKPGELAAILNNLSDNDILFIDEIHRLSTQVEEVLYPAMEDYAIDVVIGKGAGARSIRLDLPKFTLIGATTRVGMLSAPLRDRFGMVDKLEFYSNEDLKEIIVRSADVLGVSLDDEGALEIARRSRGTPRLANRLLKRCRDYAEVCHDGCISRDIAKSALDKLQVDSMGLDVNDRNILLTMIEKFDGGPVDVVIGKGAGARSIRLDLPKFTLIGATTRVGMLSAPLRDRFGMVDKLEFYSNEDLKEIIVRSADVLGVSLDDEGALEIARRSRGTPRLANRLLKRCRDYAEVCHDGCISRDIAKSALDKLQVDSMGLDVNDRNILLTMIEKFDGGPVGLDTLAAAVGEDPGTIEDVYEPYFIMNGFINRTPRGRVVTELCYRHLGLDAFIK